MRRALLALLILLPSSSWAYTAPDGAPVRWQCPGGGGVVAVTVLNKAAGNPFGALSGNLDRTVYDARYGRPSPDLCNGVAPTFLIYAERKDSQLAKQMRDACLQGDSRFADQKDNQCWPRGAEGGTGASIEVEDYAAVVGVPPSGGTGGSVVTIGQPAITDLTSPAPGRVFVVWRTRPHDAFEIEIGNAAAVRVPGSQFAAEVDLPAGYGGLLSVRVTAFLGGVAGKPSMPREVRVEPRPAEPEPRVEPPAPPVDPPAPPECPVCKPVDALACEPFVAGVVVKLEDCLTQANACSQEREVLTGKVRELEDRLLQVPAKPPMPADVAFTFKNAPSWKRWGPGQTARWKRAMDWVCSVSACPKEGI